MATEEEQLNRWATLSLGLGVAGFCCTIVTAIPAIYYGVQVLQHPSGIARRRATVGVVLGSIVSAIVLIYGIVHVGGFFWNMRQAENQAQKQTKILEEQNSAKFKELVADAHRLADDPAQTEMVLRKLATAEQLGKLSDPDKMLFAGLLKIKGEELLSKGEFQDSINVLKKALDLRPALAGVTDSLEDAQRQWSLADAEDVVANDCLSIERIDVSVFKLKQVPSELKAQHSTATALVKKLEKCRAKAITAKHRAEEKEDRERRNNLAKLLEQTLLKQGMDATVRANGRTLRINYFGCGRPMLSSLINAEMPMGLEKANPYSAANLLGVGFKKVECSDGSYSTSWVKLDE